MSQNQAVLARLRKGPLSPREALDELGCFRLAARIHDLRGEGHLILAETVKAGGKKFARYRLIPTPIYIYPAHTIEHPEPDEREGAGSAGAATTPSSGTTESVMTLREAAEYGDLEYQPDDEPVEGQTELW